MKTSTQLKAEFEALQDALRATWLELLEAAERELAEEDACAHADDLAEHDAGGAA